MLGAVVDGELPRMAPIREEVRKAWLEVIRKCALKAFVQVGVSEDVRSAYRLLITCAGLGGACPSMTAQTQCCGLLRSPPLSTRSGHQHRRAASPIEHERGPQWHTESEPRTEI